MPDVQHDGYKFETMLSWKGGKTGVVQNDDAPEIQVATPVDFGGPAGRWSGEALLVAGLETCMMSTFLYFAERLKVHLEDFSSTAKAVMEMTQEGLRFTGIDVRIDAIVADGQSREKLASARIKEKLERYCPVSAVIKCPIGLTIDISTA